MWARAQFRGSTCAQYHSFTTFPRITELLQIKTPIITPPPPRCTEEELSKSRSELKLLVEMSSKDSRLPILINLQGYRARNSKTFGPGSKHKGCVFQTFIGNRPQAYNLKGDLYLCIYICIYMSPAYSVIPEACILGDS